MKLILFGPPGSGKGTQAQYIKEELQIPHFSSGDIFRSLDPESELGKKFHEFADKGNLVPDSITVKIVLDALNKADTSRGFILDGFPRTVDQAKALDSVDSIDAVIFIDVPDEEVTKRLLLRADKEGRADDNAETIANRLATYKTQTLPVFEFYKNQGKAIEVDGVGSPEEVRQRVSAALEAL